MGRVVDFEPETGGQATRRRRPRKKPSKTALVLGGGGFTGCVYEIGALRAFDLPAAAEASDWNTSVNRIAEALCAGQQRQAA